ncbi:MAG: ArnT family glycosyltransferase [Acidobacteriota bacterium]
MVPEQRRAIAAAALLPYALAIFFGLWSLRGLDSKTPVDTDAARHAMNGVFLYDVLRHGGTLHVVSFARSYYGQYPSLSMPYHPPLFPAFEALFYLGLGVNIVAARLAIAAATAAAVLLLYGFVLKTHGSHAVAAASAVVAFSLPSSLALARDVMLEMPALALVLLAMTVLPGLGGDYSLRRGVAFGLAAGAAVWTKQNAVFLGAVPFVYLALERRRRALKEPGLWVAAGLFGAIVVALALFSASFGAAANPRWPAFDLLRTLRNNVPYYAAAAAAEVGTVPALLIAAAMVASLATDRRNANAPYLAWAASVFLVVFLLPPRDQRYLFFAYPALAVVVCSMLYRAAQAALPREWAWTAPAALAAIWFAAHAAGYPIYLHGPFEAARLIDPADHPRVLFCGRSNGSFIFAVRARDPELRTTIIRGDKFPESAFSPAGIEKFAHDYGVEYVVLERTVLPRAWDALLKQAPRSFTLIKDVPLTSSDALLNGTLRVFRFAHPSPTPAGTLELRTLGPHIEADLPREGR